MSTAASATPPSALAEQRTAPLTDLRLHVNGHERHLQVQTWATLLDLLRDRLGQETLP